ncbi:MAG: cupin domain-containing protein [Bacillota bacterium]
MLEELPFPRLVAAPDGGSHFAEVAIPVALQEFAPPAPPFCVSHLAQATQCGFLHLPLGWYGELHPSPLRMWIFVLQGEMLFEATDGGTRHLSPGSALLLEDTVGRGHVSRVLGAANVTLAVVRLPPAQMPESPAAGAH